MSLKNAINVSFRRISVPFHFVMSALDIRAAYLSVPLRINFLCRWISSLRKPINNGYGRERKSGSMNKLSRYSTPSISTSHKRAGLESIVLHGGIKVGRQSQDLHSSQGALTFVPDASTY